VHREDATQDGILNLAFGHAGSESRP
jgi:hypothetical protein